MVRIVILIVDYCGLVCGANCVFYCQTTVWLGSWGYFLDYCGLVCGVDGGVNCVLVRCVNCGLL